MGSRKSDGESKTVKRQFTGALFLVAATKEERVERATDMDFVRGKLRVCASLKIQLPTWKSTPPAVSGKTRSPPVADVPTNS
jgi:hypothetical protein